jgi:hypothetical protein
VNGEKNLKPAFEARVVVNGEVRDATTGDVDRDSRIGV